VKSGSFVFVLLFLAHFGDPEMIFETEAGLVSGLFIGTGRVAAWNNTETRKLGLCLTSFCCLVGPRASHK